MKARIEFFQLFVARSFLVLTIALGRVKDDLSLKMHGLYDIYYVGKKTELKCILRSIIRLGYIRRDKIRNYKELQSLVFTQASERIHATARGQIAII